MDLIPAAKYLRISQDREGRELGIDRQSEQLDALAERQGYRFVETYTDNDIGASTRSRKPRPEYERMLEDAKAGRFEVICAATSNRLTRRPIEHEGQITLAEDHGIRYDYYASPSFDLNTSAGRRTARILAANDAGESEDIAERVSAARRQQAQQGRYGGGGTRPFGFERDGSTIRESEADEIREMARKRLAGVSMRQLLADLRKRGIETTSGGQWSSRTVVGILTSPRVAGHSVYKGEIVKENAWPAILDEGTWKSMIRIAESGKGKAPAGRTPRWLGAGLYLCGVEGCEGTVTVHPNGRDRKPSYRCKLSAHLSRGVEDVDEVVAGVIAARLSRPDAIELLQEPTPDVDTAALHSEAVELRGMRDQLAVDYAQRRISHAAMLSATEDLNAQIAELERRMERATSASPLADLVGREDVAERWAALDLGTRRAVVRELFESVTILPQKPGRQPGGGYFNPELIQFAWHGNTN